MKPASHLRRSLVASIPSDQWSSTYAYARTCRVSMARPGFTARAVSFSRNAAGVRRCRFSRPAVLARWSREGPKVYYPYGSAPFVSLSLSLSLAVKFRIRGAERSPIGASLSQAWRESALDQSAPIPASLKSRRVYSRTLFTIRQCYILVAVVVEQFLEAARRAARFKRIARRSTRRILAGWIAIRLYSSRRIRVGGRERGVSCRLRELLSSPSGV